MKEMPGIVIVLYNLTFPKMSVLVKRFSCQLRLLSSLIARKKPFYSVSSSIPGISNIKYFSTDSVTTEGKT